MRKEHGCQMVFVWVIFSMLLEYGSCDWNYELIEISCRPFLIPSCSLYKVGVCVRACVCVLLFVNSLCCDGSVLYN